MKSNPPEFGGYYASIFIGPVSSVADATVGGEFAGASMGGLVAHRTTPAFTFPGFDMELGTIKGVQPRSALDGIFSFDFQPAWTNKSHTAAPYLTGGYSRIFVSGNALNFGSGINLLPKDMAENGHFIRIEARDYWTLASERQHLVTVRIAFCFGIPDV